jgi:mannose-6-phosphate isomerase-like protein (cupin superfamily)
VYGFRHDLPHRSLGGRQRCWTRLGHWRGGYRRRGMSYDVVHHADLEWEERPGPEDQAPRQAAALSEPAHMTESRARMWRYPANTRGRRHLDPDQEEVFVPLRGTLTMLLGEPWERVDVEPGGVVVVHSGTPLQPRNETGEEILFLAYGSPTRHGNAEFLDDVESL